MNGFKYSICVILLSSLSTLTGQIFVNDDATGARSGTTWEDAYTDLNEAIESAIFGDEIWMAEGTYIPTTTGDRYISFVQKEGVVIYGGFDGTESSLDQRNWEQNKTILSGELGDPNSILDNSIHVIRNKENGLTAASVLDGVYITRGNCNEPEPNNRGGGIFNKKASPTLRNCFFYENYGRYGAAIYNLAMSHPLIENCVVVNNHATVAGGAVYNFLFADAVMDRCVFSGNTAESICGGVFNFNSDPVIKNSLISGNRSRTSGAMYNTNSSTPLILNTTIAGNYADSLCGGIVNILSSSDIRNSIVWGNNHAETQRDEEKNLYHKHQDSSALSYSIVEGLVFQDPSVLDGTNSENDPLFVNEMDAITAPTEEGDYSLNENSKLIEAGFNGYNDSEFDLLMNQRIYNVDIDLGAYENMITVSTGSIEEVQFEIWPNPVQHDLRVHYEGIGSWDVRIFDLNGQVHLTEYGIDGSVHQVNLRSLSSGVYFVAIDGAEGIVVKKIVRL